MVIKEEQQVWSEWNSGEVFLFPGIKISKKFPWRWGTNFYRMQDRYGREQLILKFPLDVKIYRGQFILPSERHTTLLIWSRNLTFVNPLSCSIYSIKDGESKLGYIYTLVSAKKGTKARVRDELEEMELVF
jgi:hypothetical protein